MGERGPDGRGLLAVLLAASALALTACAPDTAAREACEGLESAYSEAGLARLQSVNAAMRRASVSQDDILREHARDYLAGGGQSIASLQGVLLRCQDLGLT